MKSCFTSNIRITQLFGNDFYFYGRKAISKKEYSQLENAEKIRYKLYYKQYGMKGHNGLDIVPTDNDDLRLYSLFDGILIAKYFHKLYGNRIVIWNPDRKLIEYHNHLKDFNFDIKINNKLEARTLLGTMGSTGKVFGAHDHLAFAKSDDSGNRINRGNGYFGYIDPLPLLGG